MMFCRNLESTKYSWGHVGSIVKKIVLYLGREATLKKFVVKDCQSKFVGLANSKK